MNALRTFHLCLLISLLAMPSFAAICSQGKSPAATLLVPYFEVDTALPSGRTTLFSVGNASPDPTVAYVTLWTDWAAPMFGFFVHLGADEIETINLRDVLRDLQLPTLTDADPERFPGCASVPPPALSAERLNARLRGVTDPEDGLCYGSDRGETPLAAGFITVDVARDCVADLESPSAWFEDELAGESNVLFGEVFYVDTDQNSAQGLNAVPIRRDPSLIGNSFDSFYFNDLARVPPDQLWRTRFVRGSGVDANTEWIIWSNSFRQISDRGWPCANRVLSEIFLEYRSGPESGPLPERLESYPLKALAGRIPADVLLADAGSETNGVVEMAVWNICFGCQITPFPPERWPSVIWPIVRADGRFSLAFEATPFEGPCLEEAQ